MASPTIPFQFIRSLPPADQERLRRNFDELARRITGPWLVVAADKTGDFTTLQGALNAAATDGGTTLIYVKSMADDADAQISVPSGAKVFVTGSAIAFGTMTSTGTAEITFFDTELDNSGALSDWLQNFTGTVTLDHVHQFGTGFGGLTDGTGGDVIKLVNGTVSTMLNFCSQVGGVVDIEIRDSSIFGGFVSGVIAQNLVLDNAVVTSDFGASQSIAIGSSASVFLIQNSRVHFDQGVLSVALDNVISNDEVVRIVGTQFAGGFGFAFTGINNGAQLVIDGCSASDDTSQVVTFATTGTGVVTLSNNSFKRVDIAQTGHADTHVYISGTYQSVALVANEAVVLATVDLTVTTGMSGFSVGGDNCLVLGTIYAAGASSTGVTVSGSHNVVIVTGTSLCTTPTTDSGTGNQINAFTDPLAVHTNDFRHPFVVPDGQGDAFKLRHIPIAATKPTSSQVPVYNATTKRIEWAAPTDSSAIHTGDSAGPWVAGTFPSPRTGPDFTQLFQAGIPGRLSADMIRNIPIASTKPTSNQALKYNATTKRWEPGSVAAVAVPFLVVDAAGSGDFTSIKSAVDSLSTNATANNISGIIYVKQSSSAYSDGSSTVDVAGKQVIIIGQGSATAIGMFTDTGVLTTPKWTFGGFIGSSAGSVAIYGMELGATNLTTSININFQLERCKLASLTNAASISNCNVRDCYFTAAVINVTTFALSNCIFRGCRLDAGWVIASATVTCSSIVRIEQCLVLGQVTTTVSFGNGSGSAQWEFVNNAVNIAATTTWTFNKSSTEDHYLFGNNNRNGSQTAILTMSFAGSGHGPNCVFDGNNLPYTDLTFANSASDMGLSISGIYRSLTLAQTAVSVNAVLDLRGSSSITALTLSSGAIGCAIAVTVVAGTTTTGYSIAAGANNNVITIANLAGLSTTGTDGGSGNSINAVVSGSTSAIVGTNDYRHEFELLGISSQDASRLRHVTIAPGKPGDRQVYAYLDSQKAWVALNPDYTSAFLAGT